MAPQDSQYVKSVATLDEFKEIIKTAPKVAVDFNATWCGPCKVIGPKYEALAKANPDIVFLQVDVDDAGAIAADQGITAMPTFKFFLDGEKVDALDLLGANQNKLTSAVETLNSTPSLTAAKNDRPAADAAEEPKSDDKVADAKNTEAAAAVEPPVVAADAKDAPSAAPAA
ncbi:Thioredoxin domain-containing protein 8 [Coemansia thaxteri]|uniref:Thioredoxin domain-containing protein 8 n=1 Tax=Coemansia thaxteri TaxID=2663907 RepID=A0A9W8BKU3_9FUNG|nr:Thioredoxin domain-containing protein 8 [Coemansia thaxteri]KAJ2485138.1 Thioredoxin domain-containing protein 8 [Coemansia sp. RSA 2320]